MTVEYDSLAGAYGRHRRCNSEVLRQLVTGARLTDASRVLEIGAGTGNYSRALRELTDCGCTALEPSTEMRRFAQEADSGLVVMPGRGENLPLGASSFSVLHLISQAAFDAGLARLRQDFARGPLVAVGSYVLLWATK